jgi:NAD(P)-dependent dehydrogenase (short-subunit alcohol dehydrogenase family)
LKKNYFQNKVVIITGSSRGIGRATALECARRGAIVVLNGRNIERLEKTHAMMEERGYNVLSVSGDVTSVDESLNLINKTVQAFGHLDILINNAGIVSRGGFEDTDPSVFRKIIETNILGSVYTTQFALPYLGKTGGSVVFISSIAGLRGFPMTSPYSASKMALNGIAESLKIEMAGSGVHVGIIYVSFTKNDPEKRVLAADGTMKEVAPSFQVPQERTARLILRSVKNRRFKTALTPLGKMTCAVQRVAPWFVERLLIISLRRMSKLYE